MRDNVVRRPAGAVAHGVGSYNHGDHSVALVEPARRVACSKFQRRLASAVGPVRSTPVEAQG